MVKLSLKFMGGPFSGQYRNASVIHDVACVQRTRPWKVVHKAFYNAMKASGVSNRLANIMYGAVYHFGPRWETEQGISRGITLSKKPSKTQVRQLKALIGNNQTITLKAIEALDINNL
jgi:hypothetical protein